MSQELPIHQYADEGNIAGVREELAKGVDIDAVDAGSQRTPLMTAVASPRASAELVRLLIRNGANVNAFTGYDSSKRPRSRPDNVRSPVKENVLSLAVRTGSLDVVEMLLDAGADINYVHGYGYDVLIHVMYGGGIAGDTQLIPLIRLLIKRGARLDTISAYSESALRVASREGRFDAVAELLNAGANPAPLEWTPLMRATACGSLPDVRRHLDSGADLCGRDYWSRTAWLLSLQVGEVSKAELLLSAGADRSDRGRCGKPPLTYPILNGHVEMLRWLLEKGFDPNDMDEFEGTPLMEAAGIGATACVQILIDAGADIHRGDKSERPIRQAANLDIVRLLVRSGADLSEISDEMRAALTRQATHAGIRASREEYATEKHRRFGRSNPELMNLAFWKAMVRSGAIAYEARKTFHDDGSQEGPIWCFRRYGKSITELPDGRIIEIGGEHEDYYDADFCIYNDVVVHHGDGTFDIFGYPKECFPPTDFHTATLVEKDIYVIGNLGYDRVPGDTPVYRLNTDALIIEKVETSGEKPGWISRHKVVRHGDVSLTITGGKRCSMDGDVETYEDNQDDYMLDLGNFVWSKLTRATG
jgi:ankyrin repeat protein